MNAFKNLTAPPPWALMWALAVGIYALCKLATLIPSRRLLVEAGAARVLLYVFLWPGMDAARFLDRGREPQPVSAREALLAVSKLVLGAGILLLVPCIPKGDPLLAGWTGIVGLGFLLHFGSFHVASVVLRTSGIDAPPLFRFPPGATSLPEFWSARWNLAFRQLGHDLVFEPLRPRLGPRGAMLSVFFVSGLVHELVISLPARGGWGLPSGYFALQALGILAERSRTGRRFGLGRGVRGWAFTVLLVAVPAYGLFHPPFVTRVVSPFLAFLHEGVAPMLTSILTLENGLFVAGLLHFSILIASALVPRVLH